MKSNFNAAANNTGITESRDNEITTGGIQVVLTRQKSLETCTVGTLHIQTTNLVWRCKTLELPWLDNKTGVSCIPAGKYVCRRLVSSKFGETFQVCDVPGRVGILFHAGNSAPKDTRGCVLLGVGCEISGNNAYLLASRAAMKTFMQMLEGVETFDLEILEKQ